MDDKFTTINDTGYIALNGDIVTNHCKRFDDLGWDKGILDIPAVDLVTQQNSLVLDIGAYIGDTTILFLRRNCITYAFEPFEDSFACLLHNCPDAKLYNVPVGNGETINLGGTPISNSMGSRMVFNGESGIKTLKVDELQLSKCDFIKIDVEGYEPFVLEGALQTINIFKPVIHIEVNLLALDQHGFTDIDIYKFLDEKYDISVCSFPERASSRTYEAPWDIICIPK